MKTWKAFVVLIVLGMVSQNFAMAREPANPLAGVCGRDDQGWWTCTYPSEGYTPPLPPREPSPRSVPPSPPRYTPPPPRYTPPRTPPPSPGCIRSRDNC